ncbi:hypothetical protein B0T26DRAFT_641296 [Lasiosphaeria miniovina]|uniref:Serine/threonine-protein kinase ppk6 n=1 Tax=Lasiosphaeria miniovina TaxID=1954250 RepID=A0AA40AVE7_9PEZI|nr:uncharacterized protein B0T26DRAFT_641296 [Lasiosphaeria miniovina]KAK0722743.1 hypothetical protein B0T26DRAFT_641296 [Lasiosphaeria miniovina]
MSADLFAAFEAPAPSSNAQQNQTAKPGSVSAAPENGPFSFLTSSLASPQLQSNNRQASQWPSFQSQNSNQATQANPWLPAQSNQPQNVGSWGDFGALTGTQGFSSFLAQEPEPTKSEYDDDDTWGDFEIPAAVPSPQTDPPRNRITRASTIDIMSNKLVDVGSNTSTLEPWQERPSWERPVSQKSVPKRDPNVLFDADDFDPDEDGENDFGDFEAAAAAPKPAASSKLIPDLLSLDTLPAQSAAQTRKQSPGLLLSSLSLSGNSTAYPQAPKSPYGSFKNRKPSPVTELKVKTPQPPEFPTEAKKGSPTPVTAWPTVGEDGFDNEWADFEDLPGTPDPKHANGFTAPSSNQGELGQANSKAVGVTSSPDQPSRPPPTNVPPPSILLSIFPQLLDLATTSLLKPIRAVSAQTKERVLSDTVTVTFLRGYLALATVAARVVAGRKLRWHRDKFLMQGMAISAAGGKGGMKLAGIDKTQSTREDREAADVIDIWKSQVGRLRSAVAAANAAMKDGGPPLKVPELSVSLPTHTATMVPTAPKPCVICGLKRDERIPKVDFDVEDSFGEWWVEFWGHRACRNFWVEHEAKLRQR